MNVEEYLRSLAPGLDLDKAVVERAARSPIDVGLARLSLTEDVDYAPAPGSGSGAGQPTDRSNDVDFLMRLDYASSTICYSVLGVFAGGGHTEQVGDVRSSRGGYNITMADRKRYKAMGDALRKKWGWEPLADEPSSEIVDLSYMRR